MSPWKTDIGSFSLLTERIVKLRTAFLEFYAFPNIISKDTYRIHVRMKAVKTGTERPHRHRSAVIILMGYAMKHKEIYPCLTQFVDIFLETS